MNGNRNAWLLVLAGIFWLALMPIAQGDPLSDAKAGMTAFSETKYDKAITLFTKALSSGALAPADTELAYLRRAQAYLAEKKTDLAIADLKVAVRLEPNDKEAVDLLAQTSGVPTGPTLAVTLQFIVDKLTGQGPINEQIKDEDETISTSVDTYSNGIINAPACSIAFVKDDHTHFDPADGRAPHDMAESPSSNSVEFKDIASAKLVSELEFYQSAFAIQGVTYPGKFIGRMPSAVVFHNAGGEIKGALEFADKDIATHVLKAVNHAIELCRPATPPTTDPF